MLPRLQIIGSVYLETPRTCSTARFKTLAWSRTERASLRMPQLRRQHYGTFHRERKSFIDRRCAFPTVVYSTSPRDRTDCFPQSPWKTTIPRWHPRGTDSRTGGGGGPGSCVPWVVSTQAATQAKLLTKPDSTGRGRVPAAWSQISNLDFLKGPRISICSYTDIALRGITGCGLRGGCVVGTLLVSTGA